MDSSRRSTLYTLTAAALMLSGCPASQRKMRVRDAESQRRQDRVIDPATANSPRVPAAATDKTSSSPEPSPPPEPSKAPPSPKGGP